MHWKDVVLTAHQHIHVRSSLAQESSRVKMIHSEKLKWKWVCSAVLLISGFEEKNEVMAKRTMTMKLEEDGKKCMGTEDFLAVKDYTFRKPLKTKQLMWNGGR